MELVGTALAGGRSTSVAVVEERRTGAGRSLVGDRSYDVTVSRVLFYSVHERFACDINTRKHGICAYDGFQFNARMPERRRTSAAGTEDHPGSILGSTSCLFTP